MKKIRLVLLAFVLVLMAACTPEEVEAWLQLHEPDQSIEEMLREEFAPLGAGDWAVRVARCESGDGTPGSIDPWAVNPSSGTSGVLQIHPFWNKPWHSDPVAQFIGEWWDLRFAPAINIEMGKRIYEAYGPSHWECK